MKIKALMLLTICGISLAKGQNLDKKTAAIIAEGKLLYQSEMASWNGSDVLQARFKQKAAEAGGYFSYSDGNKSKCIFFGKTNTPTPVITFTFDQNYDVNTVIVDTTNRAFTNNELELFTIRQNALKAINSDTLFKVYNNTSLNIIPLIDKDSKKVFVLTGPQQTGVVIFGNDYLLTFDKYNRLTNMKRLHKNIIPINYSKESMETTHSHLPETGDFITSTDICTLMLYGKTANWKNHIVISKNYGSIWDCQQQSLSILTTEALKSIVKEN
ncbi:MAG: hypothetical protein P0Y49_06170 [Candidatus Pedobacter colombiensis]|uniref:Uncharacterized protein n=1 Tax=Candidatus Pedobacter colombiensis TaxID=3121371 RepID=A0AAJ5W9X1_9SPHI|nr:hypothetical protein [Pedobacter sp.]WEK20722.1 MAG: hypothetical protein P0Y49_06170 [Pedobacter sp.]